MSDSVRPHRRQPTRLPRPWDSPGKNTGVGCHFLLQCMKVKSESEVAQSSDPQRPHGLQPTRLLHPWDPPGKSTGVGCHCKRIEEDIESWFLNRPSILQAWARHMAEQECLQYKGFLWAFSAVGAEIHNCRDYVSISCRFIDDFSLWIIVCQKYPEPLIEIEPSWNLFIL